MAKAALSSLSRTIASELAPHRIRVNTILPGWTDTPGELAFATADELRRGGESIPAGRLATPEDIGNAALYLLSDEASYVTGSELMVDGGITLSTQSSSSR
jgi:NAD(P)-dependent dehydrogenase (short-subunit alcohol dehydrogenase family)